MGAPAVGVVIAGSLAELIGVGATVPSMTAITLVLGLSIVLWEIPTIEDIDLDQLIATTGMPRNYAIPLMQSQPSDWSSARIVVMQKWLVEEGAPEEFRAAIAELRRERLRVGTTRSEVLEEPGKDAVFTELFRVPDARRFDAQQRQPNRQAGEDMEWLHRISRSEVPDTHNLHKIDVSTGMKPHNRDTTGEPVDR